MKSVGQTLKKSVGVLSVGRSDFGRYLPVLRALRKIESIELRIIASGGHFSASAGGTIEEIESNGFYWEPGFTTDLIDDKVENVGEAIGQGTLSLTRLFSRNPPDLLVVLGDRYEMLCGANAAIGFGIPVFHIHGGAVTEGAIDELVRHALTKMSHVHMVSCSQYAGRLRQLGEEEWRIHITGAPGLDDLRSFGDSPLSEVSDFFGLDVSRQTLICCFHPVTLELDRTSEQVRNMLQAIKMTDLQTIFTYPNIDPGHQIIVQAIEGFVRAHPERTRLIKNAGARMFAALMRHASVIIGNSSSGIVEAPTFKLPTINIGTRQDGKVKAKSVIDVDYDATNILEGLKRALTPAFRQRLSNLVNPYGDGNSGPRIAAVIANQELDKRLLRKKFVDL